MFPDLAKAGVKFVASDAKRESVEHFAGERNQKKCPPEPGLAPPDAFARLGERGRPVIDGLEAGRRALGIPSLPAGL